MSNKSGMMAMMGAAALFGAGSKGMYNLDKDYYSSEIDISAISKARRLSRRNKSVRRSRKKR